MKDILGFEGMYAITEQGIIFSYERTWKCGKPEILFTKPACFRKPYVNKRTGYCLVTLKNRGFEKTFTVHGLVARAFIENPNKLPCINHIDGNKQNNTALNLEWVSHKENTKHAIDTGLMKLRQGTEHHNNVLTEENVRDIRNLFINRELSYKKIGEIFGVNRTTVTGIRDKIIWGWLV